MVDGISMTQALMGNGTNSGGKIASTMWQTRHALKKNDLALVGRVSTDPNAMREALRCASSHNKKVREGTVGLFTLLLKKDEPFQAGNSHTTTRLEVFRVLQANISTEPHMWNYTRTGRKVTAAVSVLCAALDDDSLRAGATSALVNGIKAARESENNLALECAVKVLDARFKDGPKNKDGTPRNSKDYPQELKQELAFIIQGEPNSILGSVRDAAKELGKRVFGMVSGPGGTAEYVVDHMSESVRSM